MQRKRCRRSFAGSCSSLADVGNTFFHLKGSCLHKTEMFLRDISVLACYSSVEGAAAAALLLLRRRLRGRLALSSGSAFSARRA